MKRETQEFRWNKKSVRAARLIADGKKRQEDIAKEVGVNRVTIWRWLDSPAFAAHVDMLVGRYRKAVRMRGLAVVERRVDALNERWNKLHQVIEERAEDPSMQDVPGGKTGLITRNLKGIGKGDDFQVVEVFEADTGLLKEIREHEKQAAIELGQWDEKSPVTSSEARPRLDIPDADERAAEFHED